MIAAQSQKYGLPKSRMVVNDARQEFAHGVRLSVQCAHDRGNIARIQTDVLHMRRADTSGRALEAIKPSGRRKVTRSR